MNNNSELDDEKLKRQLRFQGVTGSLENNRKRASDESDDSSSGIKRPSKLQQKNQMLASLLACPSRPISSPNLQLPAVRMMPDIPTQMKRHDGGLPSPQGNLPPTPNQSTATSKSTNINNNNNSATKNNNIKSAQQKFRQHPLGPLRNIPGGNVKVGENIYLSQIQSQQMQQHQLAASRAAIGNILATSQANSSTSFDGQQFVSSSPSITSAPASSSNIQAQEWDPELNDILENFIEFDEGGFGEDPMSFQQMSANANAQLKQQEELAQINKIQQSLMECENEDNYTGSPPAYPIHGLTAQSRLQQQQQQQQQGFNQPPPGYTQRNIRLPMNVTSNNVVTNSNTATIAQATNSQQAVNTKQSNALMLQRIQLQHQQRIHQQQQKERLLQQQQNQQIVVTAGADQMCKFKTSSNVCDIS